MDGKSETIAVTKTIQQRCEGSTEHLVEDSAKINERQGVQAPLQHPTSMHTVAVFAQKKNEAILHIDYSEYWQRKYSNETLGCHLAMVESLA